MSFAVYHKLSGEKGLYMWLSRYFVYFIIFSCTGWIYESIYCTIRAKKWENRGFLYGPLCPIYGAGGVAITAIADLISAHTDATFTWWQIFLVAFFGSIVLEYGTSWALEKLFHAYWWDYSSMPLNINGRVCFPYSVGFGVAGLIVVYFIAPFTKLITGWMSPIWYEFFSLLLMGFLAVDTAITVSALTDFSRTIVNLQNNFNTYMDEVVEEVKERKKAADEKSQERSQELVEAVEERRKRKRIRASADRVIDSMGALKKSALNRAQGFRNPKVENRYLETFTESLKERFKRERIKKAKKSKKADK